MINDYLLAGHRIRIEGSKLTKAFCNVSGSGVFGTDTAGTPLCRFVEAENQLAPIEKVSYTSQTDGFTAYFGRTGNCFRMDTTSPDGKTLKLMLNEQRDLACFEGSFDISLLRFALWIAYGLAVLPLRTVAIHTSAIQYNGKVVLFLGESGTGKSTHTRLWRENIEGATLLNDDSPIVRIEEGKPWVYGSLWSGKTPCYLNEKYPLAACVRLSQAPYNKITKLNTIHAFGALHPSCPPFFAYDNDLYDSISHFLSLVLTEVPVYQMACLPDGAAARLSFETIFGVCGR